MIRVIFKILRIIIGSLLVLLLLFVIVIRAGYLNGFVAETISKQANKNLNAELMIGSVTGNLFSDFKLNDIKLIYNSDTILKCNFINISYLPGEIIHKKLVINNLSIGDTYLMLRQEQDSLWNILKILPPSVEADTIESTFNWEISLNKFRLIHLFADVTPLQKDSLIPQHVEIRSVLSAYYSADSLNVGLDSLSLLTRAPDFEITNLQGDISQSGSLIKWNGVILKLNESTASTDGYFDPDRNNNITAQINLTPLAFADIRSLIPSLAVYGNPSVSFHIIGDEKRYDAEAEISEGNQQISFSGSVLNVSSNPAYSATLTMKRLDLSFWLNDQKLKTDVNGSVTVNGDSFNMRESNIELEGKFNDLAFDNYNTSGLLVKASKKKDNLSGNLSSETFLGGIDLDFDFKRLFEKPAYDILCKYRNIDVGKIPGIDSVTTDLSGNIRLKGSGSSLNDLIAHLNVESYESEISGINITAFTIEADYNKGNYSFEVPELGEPYFLLSASGNGNIRKSNNISFSFQPTEPELLLSSFGIPPVEAVGKVTGTLSGTADSMNLVSDIRLDSIAIDTISLHAIDAEINAVLTGSKYSGNINLNTGELNVGKYVVNSVGLQGAYDGKSAGIDLNVIVNDSLSATFTGDVNTLDNPLILIKHLGIIYAGREWSTPSDSASVRLEENSVLVNRFYITSGAQSIGIDGKFAFDGQEDIVMKITALDLNALPLNLFIPYTISGFVNSDFSLRGTSAEPVIDGRIDADNVFVNNYAIDSIRSQISYNRNKLGFSGKISPGIIEPVLLSLSVPLHISLSDSIYVMTEEPGFSASLSLDSLNLNDISGLLQIENTSAGGYASIHAKAANSISKPDVSGTFRISDGTFRNKEFGMNYNKIRLQAGVEKGRVEINDFSAETGKGKGKLDLNGFLDIGNIDSLSPGNFELKLKASDFQALESNYIELNFNSDINITGTSESSKLGGNINVNSSKVNVDYFGEKSRQTDDPNPPLLIEALKDTVSIKQPVDTAKSHFSFSSVDLYKKMAGEIELLIPGNTWITGKDMNFELEGSLRAVKSAETINLFGDLNVKRGYYKVYGRNFEFNRGKITFTGGSEINPELDFEIIYSFRDIEKELRDLKLNINGRMLQPQIQFTLDDQALEEKDAISYIIFGKSVNQLGEGERSKISGENVAMGAALGQLSSALKGVLQEEAGVDVFEVTGGEDWKSGSVTIGKYLTNKLFLSYDRSFNFDKQTKTTSTEKIMLEYQIFRNLLFKATNQNINSGFDLIFKKTWK